MSPGICIKSSAWYGEAKEINRFYSGVLHSYFTLWLCCLSPPSVGFPRSRTHYPVIRRNSAHNFFTSTFSPLSFLIHFFFQWFMSCVDPRPAAAACPLLFCGAQTTVGLHSELHSTDSSHIPLKGPMQDQISPGVRPPLWAGAAQDIALACSSFSFFFQDVNTDFFELKKKSLLPQQPYTKTEPQFISTVFYIIVLRLHIMNFCKYSIFCTFLHNNVSVFLLLKKKEQDKCLVAYSIWKPNVAIKLILIH